MPRSEHTANKWSPQARAAATEARKRKNQQLQVKQSSKKERSGVKGELLGALAYSSFIPLLLYPKKARAVAGFGMRGLAKGLRGVAKVKSATASLSSKIGRMHAANQVRKVFGKPLKGELLDKPAGELGFVPGLKTSPRQRKRFSTNEWSEAARKKSAESRKRKAQQKSSLLGKVGKAGLIAGGALVGGALGARTVPRLLGRGKLAQAGESLMGRVVYTHQGTTKLSDIIRLRKGKTLERVLAKAAKGGGVKGRAAKAAQKVDEFFGIPQRHYGVGVGSGRIADITRTHGQRVMPQEQFGKKIYVASPGKLLKKGVVPRVDESEFIDKAQAEKFQKRFEKMAGWRAKDVCIIGSKNCEAYARGLGEGKAMSKQLRALYGGTAGGAVGGGLAVAGLLGRKKKASKKRKDLGSPHLQRTVEKLRKAGKRVKIDPSSKGSEIGYFIKNVLAVINGGPGSGFHGHKGIPGQRGGSLPEGGIAFAGASKSRALTQFNPLGLSESPQAHAKRIKLVHTKTSKLADLYDSYAGDLEAKRKKKWLPLKTDELEKLAEAHARAARHHYDAADQATLVKGSTVEQQKQWLEKADLHAKLSRKYDSRATGKSLRSDFTRSIGRAFVRGAIGGTVDKAAERLSEYAGKSAADIAAEGIRGGFREALKQRKRKITEIKDLTMPKDEVEAYEYLLRRAGRESGGEAGRVGPLTAKQRAELGKTNVEVTQRKPTLKEALGHIGLRAKVAIKQEAGRKRDKLLSGESARAKELDSLLAARIARKRTTYKQALKGLHDVGLSARVNKGENTERITKEQLARLAELEKFQEEVAVPALKNAGIEYRFRTKPVLKNNESTACLELPTANLAGQVRREMLHDREYLVAPLTMIVPGVLAGSKGPLLYPEDEISKNPSAWNGMPIVVNHPMKDGVPVEARNPSVLERYQIGTVFNARYDGKLVAEGWFDIDRTRKTNIGIYEQLVNNKPIELSTGLYTDNEQFDGTWNGRKYSYVARNYRPDHLAILLGSRGACSIKDGCGVLVNEDDEPITNIIRKTDGGYQLVSHKGKNLGKAKSKAAIVKRMRQVEYFKHVRNEVQNVLQVINLSNTTKKRLRLAGGFGGGLVGGAGGAAAGAALGSPLGPPGMLIGGAIGGATGAWAAQRAAKRLGGKSAATGANVGGLVGTLASPGGVVKGVSRLAGRGAVRAIPRVASPMTAGRIAKGVGRFATEVAAFEGTTRGLDRLAKKPKRRPVSNAWTEEARRKSASTRRRNKDLDDIIDDREDTPSPPTGIKGGIAAGTAAGVGTALGTSVISKMPRPKGPSSLKKAITRSFANPKTVTMTGAEQFREFKPGLGRKVIELLKKLHIRRV